MTEEQKRFAENVERALLDLGAEDIVFGEESYLPFWMFSFRSHNTVWPLRLHPHAWNVLELPTVYWQTATPVWGWPHTSASGDLCVSDREGVEYDPDDVFGVVSWVLHEAVEMLSTNHTLPVTERLQVFSDELEGYLRNAGARKASFDVSFAQEKALYAEVELVKKGKMRIVSPVVRRLNHGTTQAPNCLQQRLAVLDITIHQLPAISGSWDEAWWQSFILRLSPFQQQTAQNPKNRGVLLRVPNAYGHAFVLLYWGLRPQKKRTTYVIQRQDRNYLLRRTGGSTLPRHVVIVGCGSVGSRIAEQLTLCGIEKLTLIDPDVFSADNLGRHVLGRTSVTKLKVKALAALLKERMPEIEIEAISADVQRHLESPLFKNASAVVLATGNSVLERAITRQAFSENWSALIVSTSVEAGGLGGHAIAMRPGTPGCLDCLYMDTESDQLRPVMRTGLLAPEQRVSRQLTGCGAFTPYSSIDATQTALLAAERVLAGEPIYARWAGDARVATEENIQPSETYLALRAGRIPSQINTCEFAHPRCPCCGD